MVKLYRTNEYQEESADKLMDALRCHKMFVLGITPKGNIQYMKCKIQEAETDFFDYLLDARILDLLDDIKADGDE